MSKKDIKGLPIDNLLYTTEDPMSSEKTKAELEVPDPSPEKALGVLNPSNDKVQESKQDEQATA